MISFSSVTCLVCIHHTLGPSQLLVVDEELAEVARPMLTFMLPAEKHLFLVQGISLDKSARRHSHRLESSHIRVSKPFTLNTDGIDISAGVVLA